MKQDYAINADYNIGDLSTNHSFLLNGKPIGTNYTAGDGINISEDNVISVNQSIIPQGIPAGCVMNYFGYTTPAGWHDCNGGELLKSEYPALYAAIGDTFGTASSPDKFKLPDLENRFIRNTSTENKLFKTQEPGLPEIYGDIVNVRYSNDYAISSSGAMRAGITIAEHGYIGSGSGANVGNITFNASYSNSIYKSGLNDVQVKAMYARAIIKD